VVFFRVVFFRVRQMDDITCSHERASDPLAWTVSTFDPDEYHESSGSLLLDVLSFRQVCRVWNSAFKRIPTSHLIEQTNLEYKTKSKRLYDVHGYFDQYFSMCKPTVPFGHTRSPPGAIKEMRETCRWVNGRLHQMRSHLIDLKRMKKRLTV
jgi:hypothetical protein